MLPHLCRSADHTSKCYEALSWLVELYREDINGVQRFCAAVLQSRRSITGK